MPRSQRGTRSGSARNPMPTQQVPSHVLPCPKHRVVDSRNYQNLSRCPECLLPRHASRKKGEVRGVCEEGTHSRKYVYKSSRSQQCCRHANETTGMAARSCPVCLPCLSPPTGRYMQPNRLRMSLLGRRRRVGRRGKFWEGCLPAGRVLRR